MKKSIPVVLLMVLVSVVELVAYDDEEVQRYRYFREVDKLRVNTSRYLEKAWLLGLSSPFVHSSYKMEFWGDRFVEKFREYSDFREGFDYLAWWCDENFLSVRKYSEELLRQHAEMKRGYCSPETLQSIEKDISFRQSIIQSIPPKRGKILNILGVANAEAQKEFIRLYQKYVFSSPGYHFQKGLLLLDTGRFFEAGMEMSELIDSGKVAEVLAQNEVKEADFKLELAKGYIETKEYEKAVEVLTQVIQEDPDNKKAYFERAVAYFELGDFELSLEDYVKQRKESPFSACQDLDLLDFGTGMLAGVRSGVAETSKEFVPSILGSIQGLGNMVWATIQHPIDTPKEFAKLTIELCDYLRTCDKAELAQILVPEMYELVANWEQLSSTLRGELTGYVLGKYGMDAILSFGIVKGAQYVKAYQDFKRMDTVCTLETLASSAERKTALIEATNKWSQQRASCLAKLEIEVDKQGKHIRGHANFIEGSSEWTYPYPEKKIRELGGKGQKIIGEPGLCGYKERIDCGEVIGYYFSKELGTKQPTTMAVVHYSKKGVHIVPAKPKK